MTVLRVAHEFHKFPHEVMRLPEPEFEAMVAFIRLLDEEAARHA